MGGITGGVTGLFSKPVEGARKEGLGGLFKGVVKGAAGLVVKPVVGVTEAAINVVQGASNATDDSTVHTHVRLRRALPIHREGGVGMELARIEPYSEEAAKAQKLIIMKDSTYGEERTENQRKYVSHYAYRTAKTMPVTVIFTSRFLFMHAEDGEHARLPWNQVSSTMYFSFWHFCSPIFRGL